MFDQVSDVHITHESGASFVRFPSAGRLRSLHEELGPGAGYLFCWPLWRYMVQHPLSPNTSQFLQYGAIGTPRDLEYLRKAFKGLGLRVKVVNGRIPRSEDVADRTRIATPKGVWLQPDKMYQWLLAKVLDALRSGEDPALDPTWSYPAAEEAAAR